MVSGSNPVASTRINLENKAFSVFRDKIRDKIYLKKIISRHTNFATIEAGITPPLCFSAIFRANHHDNTAYVRKFLPLSTRRHDDRRRTCCPL